MLCDTRGVRVLMVPDAVRGDDVTIGAGDVARHLAEGWRSSRDGDEVLLHPSSTGAHGFLDVLRAALGGEVQATVARDPWGASVPATWLRVGRTAYVETAPLLGDPHGPDAARLAQEGSSAGVGDLVLAAARAGASRVVVGVGESGTHDAGVGALRALAGGDAGTPPGEAARGAAQVLRQVEVVVAAATDRPLTGLSGAGAALAGRPGVDGALAQQVELALSGAVAEVEAAAPRPVSLLGPETTAARRGGRRPYGGAGGGVAFALASAGARVLPGAEVTAVETALAEAIAGVDLVVTACTSLDGDAIAIGVPGVVGRLALERLVPVVAVAPTVRIGRRETSGTGIEAVYPLTDPPAPGRAGVAVDLGTGLSQRAGRVARTWSR